MGQSLNFSLQQIQTRQILHCHYSVWKCIQERSHVAIYSCSHQIPSSSSCIMSCSWATSFLQPAVATHQTYPNSASLSERNTEWMLSGGFKQCQLFYICGNISSQQFHSNIFPSRSRNAFMFGAQKYLSLQELSRKGDDCSVLEKYSACNIFPPILSFYLCLCFHLCLFSLGLYVFASLILSRNYIEIYMHIYQLVIKRRF